ncbi:UNVERIFIED_CONTAM: hypothetical protein Sradi_6155100 [Sesamum radiatum]|uniref:Uncharacterized protein n=1 Tax=Sesamum radiatum TaxID=300843 RepID=A0AAW2K7G6_SESRA
MRTSVCGIFWPILLVGLFTYSLSGVRFSLATENVEEEMVPLVEPGKVEMMVMVNESRRKLGSFQICAFALAVEVQAKATVWHLHVATQ